MPNEEAQGLILVTGQQSEENRQLITEAAGDVPVRFVTSMKDAGPLLGDAVAVAEHADKCHVVIDESLQVKVLARMLHAGYMRVRATRTNIIRFG